MKFTTLLIASISLVTLASSQTMRANHLRCEYLENPIGIGETLPRLSWWCDSRARGDKQTAYQILVASSPQKLNDNKPDLWNSGKAPSSETTQIAYAGEKLTSRKRAYWKVRVWDANKKPGPYSKPASWEMGLLNKSDWLASWVGMPRPKRHVPTLTGEKWIWFPEGKPELDASLAPRFFNTSFTIKDASSVKSASIHVIVDDEATVFLNGKKVGDVHGFRFITSLNISKLVKRGENVLAIKAWNTGGPAGFSAIVETEDRKGIVTKLAATDDRWKASQKGLAGWKDRSEKSDWTNAIIVGIVGQGAWPDPHAEFKAGPPSLIRHNFLVEGKLSRARIYATARGVYELYVDGKRVSSDVLTPGWTDYRKRIQYQTYDVTKLLSKGEHTIGVVLGDGWYSGHVGWGGGGQYGDQPMALVQLDLIGIEPLVQTYASGGDWKISTGPILSSDMMMGESYDARKEITGWATPRFNDDEWKTVASQRLDKTPLVAQPDHGIQVWDELTPKSITKKNGAYIFDLGQNMVGWTRLKVRGERGRKIQLRFAEVLNPDGTIYTTNLRGAKATDTYVLKGGREETYEPSFTFHGFRYVEVTGYPGVPTKSAIKGIVVGSALPTTGQFECSNPMLNQLKHNIYWGMRGNYLSIPTDCPQRDERLGWMGDAQIFAPTATFNCDVAPFFTKWLQDVRDGQSAQGAFADVSPRILVSDAAPAWGDAGVIVPWTVYEAYGDKRLLAHSYASMKAWVEYIFRTNKNLLWENNRNNDYGDWLSIKADTPKDVLATAFFARSTDLVARSAAVLGKKKDAIYYAGLFKGIKEAFNRAYVSKEGKIKGDTQTCYALALAFDLLPEILRPAAALNLAEDIELRHDNHLSTGFVGVKYLAPVLAENGRLDLAYKLLLNDTFPSWGYSIKQGATTIWERWDGYTKEKGFQDPGMNSFNHYSFGSIGEWMYSAVGGLQMTSPGWKTFRVKPQPGGGITWAKTGFDSPHGHIQCDWSGSRDDFRLDVTVPANVRAEVWIPGAHNSIICNDVNEMARGKERPGKVNKNGVKSIGEKGGFAVYEMGGGIYHFSASRIQFDPVSRG